MLKEITCWCSAGNEGMTPIPSNWWFPFRGPKPGFILFLFPYRLRTDRKYLGDLYRVRCHPFWLETSATGQQDKQYSFFMAPQPHKSGQPSNPMRGLGPGRGDSISLQARTRTLGDRCPLEVSLIKNRWHWFRWGVYSIDRDHLFSQKATYD